MSSYIRNTLSGLKVKSVRFQNPESGHVITIVGVMHIAHQNFWASTRVSLAASVNAGHVIHAEGVKPFVGPLLETDQRKVSMLAKLASVSLFFAELTGLPYQRHGLPMDGLNAKMIDADVLTLVRLLEEEDLMEVSSQVDKMVKAPDEKQRRALAVSLLWALKNQKLVQGIGKLLRPFSGLPDVNLTAAVLDYRNEFAVSAAVKETKPVVLLWGAAHIPGMSDLLGKAGYVVDGEFWDVLIPRSYKVP
jgi:hypothetical protein